MRPTLKVMLALTVAGLCVLVYLLMTGERGLFSDNRPVRSLDVSRLSAEDTTRLGWSPGGLDRVFGFAATISSDTLLIVSGGETVASFGDLDEPHHVHSIRKAFLSAIVGQHIGPGPDEISLTRTLAQLNVDDAPQPLTALQKTATVEHLLKSTSGINHPAAAEGGLTAEKDRRLGRGENTPGTRWAYNNWDYNALTTIFENRTGLTVADAFATGIAEPTGMQDFALDAVWYQQDRELSRHRAAQFRMSSHDLARFGQLYLDRGRAGGEQVIPARWIERIHQDPTRTGRNDLRWGHRDLWWLPGPETGLPEGTYWAWGLGNQAVFVVPARDTVIVHQSDTTEFRSRFFPAVERGADADDELLKAVRHCRSVEHIASDYCVEHRFITPTEFAGLIARIADARN